MDTRTGEVMSTENLEKLLEKLPKKEREKALGDYIKEVEFDNLPRANQRELMKTGLTKIGRNQKCACGSGKKFKNCCLRSP